MRRISQGWPTLARSEEEREAGLSQRRVRVGGRRVEARIARPRVERSAGEVYMLPALGGRGVLGGG
jgi:hypothetical protein